MKFCPVRWVENESVALRAEKVMEELQKYVQAIEQTKDKQKANVKSNSNYMTMKTHLSDRLLPAKLAFFSTLAGDIEPFLREFQSDAPMMPFLYTELRIVLSNILERFVKPEILKERTNFESLDLGKDENLLPIGTLNFGHKTRFALTKCKNFSPEDHKNFKRNFRLIMKTITEKILDKSPLKYAIVKNSSFAIHHYYAEMRNCP